MRGILLISSKVDSMSIFKRRLFYISVISIIFLSVILINKNMISFGVSESNTLELVFDQPSSFKSLSNLISIGDIYGNEYKVISVSSNKIVLDLGSDSDGKELLIPSASSLWKDVGKYVIVEHQGKDVSTQDSIVLKSGVNKLTYKHAVELMIDVINSYSIVSRLYFVTPCASTIQHSYTRTGHKVFSKDIINYVKSSFDNDVDIIGYSATSSEEISTFPEELWISYIPASYNVYIKDEERFSYDYKVSFISDGNATNLPDPIYDKKTTPVQCRNVFFFDAPIPILDGYRFVRWDVYKGKELLCSDYKGGRSIYMKPGEVVLKAVWEKEETISPEISSSITTSTISTFPTSITSPTSNTTISTISSEPVSDAPITSNSSTIPDPTTVEPTTIESTTIESNENDSPETGVTEVTNYVLLALIALMGMLDIIFYNKKKTSLE